MKRFALLALLAIAAAPALHAQASVVLPEQPLDSNRAAARDALFMLRDSLHPVVAAVARLQRDFRKTSAQSLTSRALDLSAACAAVGRNTTPVQAVVAGTATDSKISRTQQVRLEAALTSLAGQMASCATEFAALGARGNGEEVRNYGNRRAEPVRAEVRSYDTAVDRFLGSMKIPNSPLGAGPDPLAQ